MTGAEPQEHGDAPPQGHGDATSQGPGQQTPPVAAPPAALPPWPKVAGGWPSGRAERGPYADADTVDELEAWAAGHTGPAPSGPGPAGSAPPARGLAAPGGPLLAWLWGEQGPAGEYLLASHSVTVGRDPGSDIVLIDETVSREHARIEHCEGQWWLQLAEAAGPTWVNGEPVAPGRRLPVSDGDRLRFGFHTQFRLLVPNAR